MQFRLLFLFIALISIAATPAPTKQPVRTPASEDRGPQVRIALPNYDEETSTKLQIFLDNNYFGPGKIDGKMGEFFRKALVHYKRSHAMPETGVVDQWLIDQVPEAYTTYTVTPEAENFVGPTASKPSEQSKLKRMKYGSLLEFVAERYHSAEEFLKRLNPEMDLEKLKVGDSVKVPNVIPFKIEDLTEGFAPLNPELVNRRVFVDTKERFLLIYEDKQLVAEFPITPGSSTLPAPLGLWKILGIATLPVFRHDEGVLNHGVKSEEFYNLPPGPNNPVGVLWIGLNKPHVGIHGTNNPETIGRAASHGCIRTANWDAARVKDLVTIGNPVSIFK